MGHRALGGGGRDHRSAGSGGGSVVVGPSRQRYQECISGVEADLDEPARIVEKQGLDDAAIDAAVEATRAELGALTNLYTPAAYKSALARGLVRRALQGLRAQTS